MTTLHSRKSIDRSALRLAFLLIPLPLAIAWFAVSPAARAVTPPPDGGYPNRNTAEGDFALFSADVEAGNDNTAIGFSTLFSNVGSFNTAIGSEALYSNTASHDNTATGSFALHTNTIGNENTATGATALLRNTTGNDNTATGVAALQSNTTGDSNTATGAAALALNTTGNNNTANGVGALFNNRIGVGNTASGEEALSTNTNGFNNTAIGVRALTSATANGNTATGANALLNDNTGANNTANGFRAIFNNTTGSRNIALGFNAGANLTTGDSNIDIGNAGGTGDAGTIRIGMQGTHTRTFVAGISGSPIIGTSVVVNSNGRLGTVASSQRFKDAIKPMDEASEAILALKPVTFHYKKEIDPEGIPQFGLVAEDVEKVNPDLVARDTERKVYTVRYDAVNAMLLNEFLKEHRKVEKQEATITQLKSAAAKQEATIAQQQKRMETVIARLEEQATQIQKVGAQLGVSKTVPQIVLNNQ